MSVDDAPRFAWDVRDVVLEPAALVATIGEFMNPWHDEIGRFAPKGTGTKSGAVTDDFAEPPPSYIPEAAANWRAAYAYMAEHEMPAWWMGTEFMDADGLPVQENKVGQNWDHKGINEETEVWKQEVGEAIADGVWMIGRAADRRREQAIRAAISTNQIDLVAAEERWGKYDIQPISGGKWEDLPPVLYHATSAMSAIAESGMLKTRDEIGGRKNAAGLGGGEDDTISFTADREVAEGIVRSLHEVRRAVTMDNDSLRDELEERAGDWWPEVVASYKSIHGTPDGQPRTVEDRYNLYRTYAAYRQQHEGVLDPLFFNVDVDRLATMNPDDIGIVTVEPAMPGARGYQVSALGEWRTPTGAATRIVDDERVGDHAGFTVRGALTASASIIADFEDSYLTELTGAVEQSLRSIRQLVIGRLRARATITTPIAASAARVSQFMNPWHDEIGRFAPKGTGRNVGHRNVDENYYPESTVSIPGIGDVDEYLAAHPREPGEAVFVWHGRLVDGLPPLAKHALLFEIRERYQPVDYIVEGARRWRAEKGLPEPQVAIGEVPVDLPKAYAVARVFEEMPDQSHDPHVQAAYTEFKRQNREMYDFMTRPESEGGMGIKVDFWTSDDPSQFGVGPYADASAQADDLRDNHHIFLEANLGGEHEATMTQQEYDEFRAVHDVFGHAGVGGGFDRHGEYQAYLEHASMYTGAGREAMASEYHGVNTALWTGEPGTPGTGKSVILPAELIANPWDETGALQPPPSPEELARFLPTGERLPENLVASAAPIEALRVSEATIEALRYLAEQAGIQHPFAQQYDVSPFHHVPDALVAAGPFDLDDFNVMTAEEWAAAFDVEAADIVGDVVVDAATGQPLRPGLNVTDKVITDLIDRHVGRLQDLGPLVQASLRDALHLAIRNQLTLDEVIREIQATGPLGETAARAIARTELTAATNGGMLTGWKRDGLPFKAWHSLHDDRVRHAHLEADGQVVPTEQEFEVGGYRAHYPGDPRLPVHLRINCRCYMDRIGEDGQTLNTRLVDSTRAQLYKLAQELQIPGRSKMRKPELFQAIDRYRNGFGYTSLEEMNRAQLLIRARVAGIVGRHRMTKPELMIRLRDLSTGRNRDRWLIDAGHGTREQLAAVQAQLAADIAALHQGPIVGAGPQPTVEKIDVMRRKVFRRYGGADTGTAMCVGCGARLHWSNATRWEQLTLIRIDSKLGWSARNAFPACLADAAKLVKLDSEKIATTFTIDTSWGLDFANPWHDEEGKFAPKGTGTKYDSAAIKGKVKASTEAGVNVDRVGDPQATLTKLDAWAEKMGPDFDADEGVGMIREALNDAGAGSKTLIANHKNGIAGIISYDYDPDTKTYTIHHLGSTGIAPGTGTRLAAQVMIQAASNGAGIEFEAANNDTAPEFWSSLGFDVDPGRALVTMSPSDVGAWMRDFTS